MTAKNTFLTGLLFVLWIIGCKNSKTTLLFHDLSPSESGVNFSNNLIETDALNIIQYLYFYNGGGVTVGDVNGDLLPDLFFASNMGGSQLYLNQTSDDQIRFINITEESGLGQLGGWSTGVNFVDINGDEKLDIYICQVNYKNITGRNRLLINQGNENGVPVFHEESSTFGLDFQGLSTHSAFFDYDLDGDLDMYLLNHSVHAAENYASSEVRKRSSSGGDRLYRNDGGLFVDVTTESGIYNSQIGFGLGLGISDLNKDGYPDIYVGNDFHENDYLYINNGDGTFSEVIEQSTGHTTQFSMGLDIADINNDGWSDILSLDMMPRDERIKRNSVPSDTYEIYEFKHEFGYHYQLPRNNLQLHRGVNPDGKPVFSEIAQLVGIEDTDWSWSSLLADYNNDGKKDLFISNGIARRPNDLDYLNYISNPLIQQNAPDKDLIDHMPEGLVSNFLFENEGDLQFADISGLIENNVANISTGAAYADLDQDGDLDIVTNNINAPASILINQTNSENYIKLRIEGDRLNKKGWGTKVTVYTQSEKKYYEHYPVRGFMSSSADDLIVGLGDHNVDSLVAEFPGGYTEIITDIKKGQNIIISFADAKKRANKNGEITLTQFVISDRAPDFTHLENSYIDVRAQKLMPWLLSTQGPALALGDVNNDGMEDIFIGGAKGQSSALFMQNSNFEYDQVESETWVKDAGFEDVDALFFDADNDKDMDLYVVSGGNEDFKNSPFLLDRIYFNDGAGNFTRNLKSLPLITENGSCVAAADFDNDGDLDLASGSIVASGIYGYSPGVHLLVNDGNGKFGNGTDRLAPELKNLGMITGLLWSDIDQDNDQDIVIVGEWMPITIMINNSGRFSKIQIEGSTGLWRTVEIADLDGDGKEDIIAGNFGTNTFLAQSSGMGMAIGDFDENNTIDPLLYYTNDGTKNPVAGRDLLINQMNFFKNLHPDYNSFAAASFDEMFAPVFNKLIKNVEIEEWTTCWYKNLGNGNFKKMTLPKEAQFAPSFAIEVNDYNHDGATDILLGGNFYEISPIIGRADGSIGVYLQSDGKGSFTNVPPNESGFLIDGQIRGIESVLINQKPYVLIARNNQKVQLWKVPPGS